MTAPRAATNPCAICGAPRTAEGPTCVACDIAIHGDELPPCVGQAYADTAADMLRDPEARA